MIIINSKQWKRNINYMNIRSSMTPIFLNRLKWTIQQKMKRVQLLNDFFHRVDFNKICQRYKSSFHRFIKSTSKILIVSTYFWSIIKCTQKKNLKTFRNHECFLSWNEGILAAHKRQYFHYFLQVEGSLPRSIQIPSDATQNNFCINNNSLSITIFLLTEYKVI